ncbi:MAG: phage tail protein [Herpetosiphon sp.]|nr:phage tail protein [Herpetosiphon sp.]
MPNAANETVIYPYTTFNFAVEINRSGSAGILCNAAFAECDGLELSMDVKTIREGGNNTQQIRLAGATTYGNLTLKRGMTDNSDIWRWMYDTQLDPRLRADAEVVLFAPDGQTVRARFELKRCLPIKIKAPALNAKDGMVAIEELQIAYESLQLKI